MFHLSVKCVDMPSAACCCHGWDGTGLDVLLEVYISVCIVKRNG
jgi:hypothetical protein